MIRVTGIMVVLVAAAAIAGALWARQILLQPLPLSEELVLDVGVGSSLTGIANRLADQGLLAHPAVLAWYGRLSGQAGSIQAGEYAVPKGTTPYALLDLLVEGRVKLYSLTVIEGWTVKELLTALTEHPAIKITLDAVRNRQLEDLARDLELETASPEGWFFPDTYHFPRGTTDARLLLGAHRIMKQRLLAAWDKRQAGLPYETPYEALILASIVERETALDSERPQIAGVFVRRLRKGMRLQTDPTVIYGLGDAFDGNLTRRHLKTDSAYNTYMRKGLPPTPIALPGAGSLQAVMNPDDGNALYFVATGQPDGSHYFTASLEEHNAAVRRYLRRLRENRQ